MKASAKVSAKSPHQKGTVDELVSAERPARLHLETLDFFGRPIAVLVTADGHFSLFDSAKGVFYRGPASPENIGRLLPVSMWPADVVSILLGSPALQKGAATGLALEDELRAYRLTLSDGAVAQTLWVGTHDLRLLRSDLGGKSGYRVDYGDFADEGATPFARAIKLTAPAQDVTVNVRLSEVELNPASDPGMYVLNPPPGANVIDLDAGGTGR